MQVNVKWVLLAGVALVVMVLVLYAAIADSHSFNAKKVAQAKTRMWKAYYARDPITLGLQLIDLFHSQYGMGIIEAKDTAKFFGRAALKFGASRQNYEAVVLGDLTKAYEKIKNHSGASFDPKKAARAELAWWVARRTPGQDSAEQVGAKIAELYAVLYGRPDPAFTEAGRLRAQAAALRDAGGQQADWAEVENLLTDSYRILAGFDDFE